ncbi:hypothetical protein [Planotetraspora kaengkrachanensis]|uniref:Uncharacterized protein n=1 Tax=Planotetraspora kaengkrachanensis TaxID=575193 RepID=A0A8J3LVQ3_9ACTN|nr:hypothetical protein [Planotetraspora kaengkrachanensis]GIG77660.1 hypothetical protein Pka01_07870 [Planotetraspora kaengkrachanensis]
MFVCADCEAVLTAPVSSVALPAHAYQTYGYKLLPALLEPGTYAVDPEPSGSPWRRWDEVGAEEAEARGVYAPVYSLSYGPPGEVAVAPGDIRGTTLIPDRCDGSCCGLDGRSGPNLACAQCGQAVASLIDDCSMWQVVWLDPSAVRRVDVDAPARRVLSWEELRESWPEKPPVEPTGAWSPEWEAAVAVALAHLIAVSDGVPVIVPGGHVADVFRRAVDALLPPGPPARTLTLAGPGLSATGTDIALVPRHPQTGDVWPSGTRAAVPLAAEVWMHLAFDDARRRIPATGGLPDGVHRDDPPPLLPFGRFRPDWNVFLYTLARMPEVRQPWLRAIHDRVRTDRSGALFW